MRIKQKETLTDMMCAGANITDMADTFKLPLHVVEELLGKVDRALEDSTVSEKEFFRLCKQIDQQYS